MNKEDVVKSWRGQMCTGLFSTKGPGPSAKLIANSEQLEIKGVLGNFTLKKQDVERIERGGFFPWLWCGIRIRHTVASYPKMIMFWPQFSRSRKIMEHLRLFGYEVS